MGWVNIIIMKGLKDFRYQGISFVADNIYKIPVERFVTENKESGLTPEQLREAHGIAVSKMAKAAEPAPAAVKK